MGFPCVFTIFIGEFLAQLINFSIALTLFNVSKLLSFGVFSDQEKTAVISCFHFPFYFPILINLLLLLLLYFFTLGTPFPREPKN